MTGHGEFARVLAGRRVLVTGHTGFKGAWLAAWLHRLGAQVVGFSLEPPSSPCLFDVLGLDRLVTSLTGDVRDLAALDQAMTEHRPEVVVHMAAQPLVRLSFRTPVDTFSTNVMGTVNVLDACRRAPSVRAVVNVTSDKCYENREWPWGYRENDPMGGHDPYSASKGCAELAASAFMRSYFSDAESDGGPLLASARAGNVIGGGDWGADRLVPDCARALSEGSVITIRRPQALRPWQHVLEPLSGYLLLAARLLVGDEATNRPAREFSGGWNFGPRDGVPLTVAEVAGLFCELWGGGNIDLDPGPHPHEAHYLKLDCSKAALGLGWRARWDGREAVERTVAWYRQFYDGASPAKLLGLMYDQIDEHGAAPAHVGPMGAAESRVA